MNSDPTHVPDEHSENKTMSISGMMSRHLVMLTDVGGTGLLAITGASIAADAHLDLLGVAAVAFVNALGGGIMRDLLLGCTPPAALRSVRYVIAVALGTVVALVINLGEEFASLNLVRILTSAGLALFTVAGTGKALNFGCRGYAAVILGTLGATGGGVLRDILLNRVPRLLTTDVIASSAMCGAITIVVMRSRGFSPSRSGLVGGFVCVVFRLAGVLLHLQLPKFR